MFPISKRLPTVAASDKISLKYLSSSVKFIVARRTGWTTVQSFIRRTESKSDISEVGVDNCFAVSVAEVVESDPAVFTPSRLAQFLGRCLRDGLFGYES